MKIVLFDLGLTLINSSNSLIEGAFDVLKAIDSMNAPNNRNSIIIRSAIVSDTHQIGENLSEQLRSERKTEVLQILI